MNKLADRIIHVLDSLLNLAVYIVVIVLLFISGYSLLDNYRLHQQASDDSLLVYKPVLDEQSKDPAESISLDGQVGWLCVENTYIDYPLMQGQDNFEYLNKDPYGEFKLSGSIFLDSGNAGDLTDPFSMIYGHHMDHYSMFGSLDLFAVEAYYNYHRDGWIATKDQVYDLKLFAVVWGMGDDWEVFSPAGKTVEDVLAYIEPRAVINSGYEPGHRIVCLSTCAGEEALSRLLVFGMIKERTAVSP